MSEESHSFKIHTALQEVCYKQDHIFSGVHEYIFNLVF